MADLTLSEASVAIYNSVLHSITHKILVETLLQEQVNRTQFGPLQPPPALQPAQTTETPATSRNTTPNTELITRNAYHQTPGRDIFGNEKVPDSARYFECQNCMRKIAGNRFAAHIDRCLGGRQRKG